MPKKKLIHFRENLTFPHLFQPSYAELAEGFPLRGEWRAKYFGNDHPIVAELGCGKGEYTVGLAARNPAVNYIGIDWKGARLWRGCKTVSETGATNVAFLRMMVDHIDRVFAPGELSGIWITFPDPQVKKERRRLTAPVFLSRYANILESGGLVHLKTDDTDFFDYTLQTVGTQGYPLLFQTRDLYSSGYDGDATSIRTFYEARWIESGKKICYLTFQIP